MGCLAPTERARDRAGDDLLTDLHCFILFLSELLFRPLCLYSANWTRCGILEYVLGAFAHCDSPMSQCYLAPQAAHMGVGGTACESMTIRVGSGIVSGWS